MIVYRVIFWIYQHFRGIGSKDAWGGYREEYPRAMLFAPQMGLSTPDEYIAHVDALDLRTLSWPHMLSTVRHVLLSGSGFSQDDSDTVTAW